MHRCLAVVLEVMVNADVQHDLELASEALLHAASVA